MQSSTARHHQKQRGLPDLSGENPDPLPGLDANKLAAQGTVVEKAFTNTETDATLAEINATSQQEDSQTIEESQSSIAKSPPRESDTGTQYYQDSPEHSVQSQVSDLSQEVKNEIRLKL